jgi:hypothetical protein
VNQIRFDDIFECPLIFAHRRRQGIEADRSTGKFLDQGRQEGSVESVKTRIIHIETLESEARRIEFYVLRVAISDGRKVADAPQESIRDSRRATSPPRNFLRRLGLDLDSEEPARAQHDLLEIGNRVVFKPR